MKINLRNIVNRLKSIRVSVGWNEEMLSSMDERDNKHRTTIERDTIKIGDRVFIREDLGDSYKHPFPTIWTLTNISREGWFTFKDHDGNTKRIYRRYLDIAEPVANLTSSRVIASLHWVGQSDLDRLKPRVKDRLRRHLIEHKVISGISKLPEDVKDEG